MSIIMHETTPLLPRTFSQYFLDEDVNVDSIKHEIKTESIHLLKLAGPILLTYFLEYFPGVVTIMLVGHAENADSAELHIDAASLAVMFINMTGLSIGFGLATALDTLASQAYGASSGRRDDDTVRIRLSSYLLAGIMVLSLVFIPICFVCVNSTPILIFLGEPLEVSILTGKFVKVMLPGIPFLFLYELIKKIMQAQNIVKPMMYVALCSNFVNIVIGYILVVHSPMGWMGAAVAQTCCNISLTLFLLKYLFDSDLIRTMWMGWNFSQAFKEVGKFVRLGFAGMLMLCLEWWAFEMLALICGLLPDAVLDIGANAVALNIASSTYMLYLGLSVSGSVRTGNALGAGDPVRAKIVSFLTIIFSTITGGVCAILLLIFKETIPFIFTNNKAINKLTSELMHVVALFQLCDGFNAANQGIFRGSGQQSLGAKLNMVSFYVVGIPCGSLLAFKFGLDLIGLWWGMTLSLFFGSLAGVTFICRTDWETLAKESEHLLRYK